MNAKIYTAVLRTITLIIITLKFNNHRNQLKQSDTAPLLAAAQKQQSMQNTSAGRISYPNHNNKTG